MAIDLEILTPHIAREASNDSRCRIAREETRRATDDVSRAISQSMLRGEFSAGFEIEKESTEDYASEVKRRMNHLLCNGFCVREYIHPHKETICYQVTWY